MNNTFFHKTPSLIEEYQNICSKTIYKVYFVRNNKITTIKDKSINRLHLTKLFFITLLLYGNYLHIYDIIIIYLQIWGEKLVKNKLKEIRMREYMLNQKDFCKLIGISPSTYNPIENNVKQGNAETILLIAKGLNRKVEDIWYLVD